MTPEEMAKEDWERHKEWCARAAPEVQRRLAAKKGSAYFGWLVIVFLFAVVGFYWWNFGTMVVADIGHWWAIESCWDKLSDTERAIVIAYYSEYPNPEGQSPAVRYWVHEHPAQALEWDRWKENH